MITYFFIAPNALTYLTINKIKSVKSFAILGKELFYMQMTK
jgi:hypothetical protein